MSDRGSRIRALVLGAALVAVVVATIAGLETVGAPAPAIFGSLVPAMVFSLAFESRVSVPDWIFRAAQAVIGVVVASEIDFGQFVRLGRSLPLVILVSLATLGLSVASGQLLAGRGISRVTATFASVAGGASGVSAMARDYGADDRIVVVVQYFRVVLVLTSLPLVTTQIFGVEGSEWNGSSMSTTSLSVGVAFYMAANVVLGPLLGALLRLPSPALVGSLLVASMLGPVAGEHATVPPPLQLGALCVLGTQAGLRFSRDTVHVLMRILPVAITSIGMLMGGCALLGVLLSSVTAQSNLAGYLATSPGGLPIVLATADSANVDMTFVSTVQMLRLALTLVGAPLAVAAVLRWRGGRASD